MTKILCSLDTNTYPLWAWHYCSKQSVLCKKPFPLNFYNEQIGILKSMYPVHIISNATSTCTSLNTCSVYNSARLVSLKMTTGNWLCFWLTESVQARCVVDASMQVDLTAVFYLGSPQEERGMWIGRWCWSSLCVWHGEVPGCSASPNIPLTDRLQLDTIVRWIGSKDIECAYATAKRKSDSNLNNWVKEWNPTSYNSQGAKPRALRLVNRPLSWCSNGLVLVFNPAGDVKATHWATHLINICSVFILQHNHFLALLCLQSKNNSGMLMIYTHRYGRALVEKYFCVLQPRISGITRVL